MARSLALAACALLVLGVVFSGVARADDASSDPMKQMVREEVDAYMKSQKNDFRVFWKNGLNFATHDGKFKMSIGGRLQLDYAFFDDENVSPPYDPFSSGYEFRRARLYVAGQMYKYIKWRAQYDFAGGCENHNATAAFKDLYMQFVHLNDCFGCMFPDIAIGHFKEYFSLEELTSSKYITFMERALPVTTFAPSRNTGLGLFRNFMGDHMTVGLGVWGHNNDNCASGLWRGDGTQGGYDITGRLTGLVWAPCDCESRFWEVGASFSYQDGFEEIRYRTRPEIHTDDTRIADTGAFAADSAFLYAFETAFGYDRWHAQAELIGSAVSSDVANDPTFMGWYVEASYMLAGGHRPFRRSYATFDKVKPCTDFLAKDCRGAGGWEVAVRYGMLDLSDGNIAGGEVSDLTLGVNWYLNTNTAIKFNYIYSYINEAPGGAKLEEALNTFGIRFQVWF